ncbi:MAG: hypothetical protein KJZ54_07570 [Phycisphaerales bacterium]|nr:hypothetical protein [Phycisphaerales bacterium]
MARSTTTRTRGTLALLIAAATIAKSAALAFAGDPLAVDVMANVKGFDKPQKIGTINAASGYKGHANAVSSKFEFHKDFAFLDKHYDFDYVNVVRDLSDGYKPLFPKGAPAIDPQSGDVSGSPEDDVPYYYHFKNEWQANTFDGGAIREDEKWSMFIDFPKAPKGDFLDFTNILVVRDHDSVKFEGKNQFGLLTAFDWRYDGADGTGNRGVSKIGDLRATDAALQKLVNDAMANEHLNAFKGWSSMITFTLVPTPGTLALLSAGAVLCVRRRRAA